MHEINARHYQIKTTPIRVDIYGKNIQYSNSGKVFKIWNPPGENHENLKAIFYASNELATVLNPCLISIFLLFVTDKLLF